MLVVELGFLIIEAQLVANNLRIHYLKNRVLLKSRFLTDCINFFRKRSFGIRIWMKILTVPKHRLLVFCQKEILPMKVVSYLKSKRAKMYMTSMILFLLISTRRD